MDRNRTRREREGVTLGDALSPSTRSGLVELRDKLINQVRETVESQLAQAPPPWRRRQGRTTDSASPAPTNLSRQQPERGKRDSGVKPTALRKATGVPKPQKPTFEFWEFPGEATLREPAPTFISEVERSEFEQLLRASADFADGSGEELFLILGLDLGTSSTKTIVRLPFEPGEPTIAIPVPNPCRSDQAPYLWRTSLWLDARGAFFPWPEPGATVLDCVKQGLMLGRSETPVSSSRVPVPVSRAQVGVAYLAFVIRYVRGWLLRHRHHLFTGRKPVWFVSLGMPAASYDDLTLAQPYRRIGAAALQLAKTDTPVSAESADIFLNDPHVIRAGTSEADAESLGVAVFPEAAAEMTGFARSTRGAPDLYLMVDIGAMTLDACLFRLNSDAAGGSLYSFMAADVRPLGVESFHWFRAEGKTEAGFKEQCSRMLHSVVLRTSRRKDPHAATWKPGNDVPVFIAGGGAANPLHQDIVESLGPWLRRYVGNEGIRPLDLHVPNTLDLPEPLEDLSRMAVAWGLSYPATEIGRIRAERDIKDVPPRPVVDSSSRFVSKDQV